MAAKRALPLWRSASPWFAAHGLNIDALLSTTLRDMGSALPIGTNWLLPLALCALLVARLTVGTKVQ